MRLIKIAFDIATKNIGVCLMIGEKNKLATIKLDYDENNLQDVFQSLFQQIKTFLGRGDFVKLTNDWLVGLEVSNFKNPKITQRFSFIAGLIIGVFEYLMKDCGTSLHFKIFNSNQWQSLIGCKTSDDRSVRKQKAKDFVFEKTGVRLESEDEADAFCIAWFLEQLNTTQDISITTKKNKANKAQNKAKIAQLNKQIITRQNKLLKLTPKQVKMKERLENEIRQIKDTISKLNDC